MKRKKMKTKLWHEESWVEIFEAFIVRTITVLEQESRIHSLACISCRDTA